MKFFLSLIILSFYLIQINCDKPTEVVNFAKSKIGCGYVWGSSGQILTEQNLKEFQARHPEHVDPNIVKQWLGMQVFDCAGFVRCAFNTVGYQLALGATSIWDQRIWEKKGVIKDLPKDKVCILFRGDGHEMEHIGIYIKNGEYIHAKGSKSGVVKESMTGSRWTHWGMPKDFYPAEKIEEVCSSYPCQAKVANASSGRVNFRVGPDTSKDIIMKIDVGEIVTVNSYSNGWYQITYKNKTGYMMAEYLVKV